MIILRVWKHTQVKEAPNVWRNTPFIPSSLAKVVLIAPAQA